MKRPMIRSSLKRRFRIVRLPVLDMDANLVFSIACLTQPPDPGRLGAEAVHVRFRVEYFGQALPGGAVKSLWRCRPVRVDGRCQPTKRWRGRLYCAAARVLILDVVSAYLSLDGDLYDVSADPRGVVVEWPSVLVP